MKERMLRLQEGISRLRQGLGVMGLSALGLLALAGVFFLLVLKPLQEKSDALARRAGGATAGQAEPVAAKLAALYGHLEKPEATTDWLVKLHGIAKASGVEVKTASYRTQPAGARLERYEIVLPVAGSYPQIRAFLKRSLADIPVLSLDQVTLRRESRNDGVVQAELRLSLHRVKS